MLIHNILTVNEVTVLSVKNIKFILKHEQTKCQLADFFREICQI